MSQQVEIFNYIELGRSEVRAVLNKDLLEKALHISESIGIHGFLAPPMWLYGWKCSLQARHEHFTKGARRLKVLLTHFLFYTESFVAIENQR